MKYDAVFFDSGGTLYGAEGGSDPTPSEVAAGRFKRIEAALRGQGVPLDSEELVARLTECETECKERPGEAYTFFKLMSAFGEPLGLGNEAAACLADAYAGPRYASWLFPGTRTTVQKLCESGLYLGIVANTAWPGFCMDRAFAGVGLLPYFATRIYSGDLGIAKPDPKIFRRAEEISGKQGQRILYVGNDLNADIRGASGVGWATAFRTPRVGSSEGAADFEFQETSELLEFILGTD